MNEGERQRVDATMQTEEGRGIVDEQAQTNDNLMPDNSRMVWNRVRVIFFLLPYGCMFIGGICFWQKILSTLPNFRRYMFDEQSEVKAVTETEQGVLWTLVFVPVTSLFFNICIHIYQCVRSVPWLWRKIVELTSYYYIIKQIRQQIVSRAIVPLLRKYAVQFAKKCLVVMALLAGVMLMIIGLHSIMEQYNFAFHMNAFVSHLRGAIPYV